MKVYCNCCGKEIVGTEDTKAEMEDYVIIEKSWGYFSKKDGIRHKIRVCESCYDKWVKTFALPLQEEEERELL